MISMVYDLNGYDLHGLRNQWLWSLWLRIFMVYDLYSLWSLVYDLFGLWSLWFMISMVMISMVYDLNGYDLYD